MVNSTKTYEKWFVLVQCTKTGTRKMDVTKTVVEEMRRASFSWGLCSVSDYAEQSNTRWLLQDAGKFSTSWATTGFQRTLLHVDCQQSNTHGLEHRAEQQPLKPFNMMTFHLPVYYTPQLGLRVARSILISALLFETTFEYPNWCNHCDVWEQMAPTHSVEGSRVVGMNT